MIQCLIDIPCLTALDIIKKHFATLIHFALIVKYFLPYFYQQNPHGKSKLNVNGQLLTN